MTVIQRIWVKRLTFQEVQLVQTCRSSWEAVIRGWTPAPKGWLLAGRQSRGYQAGEGGGQACRTSRNPDRRTVAQSELGQRRGGFTISIIKCCTCARQCSKYFTILTTTITTQGLWLSPFYRSRNGGNRRLNLPKVSQSINWGSLIAEPHPWSSHLAFLRLSYCVAPALTRSCLTLVLEWVGGAGARLSKPLRNRGSPGTSWPKNSRNASAEQL